MSIILFAIIGAQIHAGTWYWIFYGLYCSISLYQALKETIKEVW